jgi:Zn-dependent M28 family amino/carboxypeptidase
VPLRRVPVTGTNLYAELPGARQPEHRVLLTAHYDGVGDDPGLRLPAASDNASGVSVVLEVARLLARHPVLGRGVRVALLDAEEVGALGSAHHATTMAHHGQAPWVVNVDGAGRLAQAVAVEAGGPADPLLHALERAARRLGIPLAAGAVASDNRRYAAAGLPTLGLGAGMPGYHTPADTPDRVDPATLTLLARLVLATVWQLATTPAIVSSLIGDER